jgi:hypothetical protein
MDLHLLEGEAMRDTIDMALEAGWDDHHAGFDTRIDRLVALVRADEREACAKVCDVEAMKYREVDAFECAAAIRARGNTMSIEIEREKLERMLMLLAVATFHTPALQAERTELVEAGLKALAAPVQEPVDSVQAIGNLMFALTTWKATTSKTAPPVWKKLLQACSDMVATEQPAPVQPAVQEPVAWICYGAPGKRDIDFEEADIDKLPIGTLLYTSPPAAQRQWVGLSDEEVVSIGKELGLKCKLGGNPNIDFDYAEAIEAKLKQKNTP